MKRETQRKRERERERERAIYKKNIYIEAKERNESNDGLCTCAKAFAFISQQVSQYACQYLKSR